MEKKHYKSPMIIRKQSVENNKYKRPCSRRINNNKNNNNVVPVIVSENNKEDLK